MVDKIKHHRFRASFHNAIVSVVLIVAVVAVSYYTLRFVSPVQGKDTDIITLQRLPNAAPSKIGTAYSGRFVQLYETRQRGGNFQPFITIASARQGKTSSVTYKVLKPQNKILDEYGARTVYDPQFSPDGESVLFKFGDSTSFNGAYRLYVLSLRDAKVNLVSPRYLSYQVTSWSPDGKYIAFVEGGDATGGVFTSIGYIGPLRLFVTDWKNQKESLVRESDSVRGPFTWTTDGDLIYGALTKEDEAVLDARQRASAAASNVTTKQPQTTLDPKKTPALVKPRPNIYKFSFKTQESQLLLSDGYLPVLSPDNTRLAFFGSADTKDPDLLKVGWQDSPQGSSLCVADLDGANRTALNREGAFYPSLKWLPNGVELLAFNQVKPSPNSQAEVRRWNTQTGRFEVVARLSAKDFEEIPRSTVEPQFSPLALSANGQILFVRVSEYIGLNSKTGFLTERGTVRAVDLKANSSLVISKNDKGAKNDWYPL